MSNTPDHDTAPEEVPIETKRHRRLPRFSLVWLVPLLALAVALGVAWQNYADRGPLIEVSFRNAEGVLSGETELRHRDIAVGYVEDVGFGENLETVIVSIRVDKEMARFVDADASFWVVRPRVSAQGVSGLDTVLSGVYIEGAWDGTPGEPQSKFDGLADAPLLEVGQGGTVFHLFSDTSLPTGNPPIIFRGVEIGRIGAAEVSEDGLTVEAEAVIFEPFERLVTSSTRFWDISGFSFSLDAAGARLDITSLASLITGGVTFETMASGGEPLNKDSVFELHRDEKTAREDYFIEGDGTAVDFMMVFDENLSGLSAGAPVQIGGLRVGEVATISGIVDEDRFGDGDVRLLATLRLNPGRIGLDADAGEEGLLDYLDERVANGLRGQLRNASLLTGGLRIDLVEVPDAAPASIDRNADPFPQIPTAPAEVRNVAASAQGLLQRVDDLPVEELLESAIAFLDESRSLVGSEALQAAPDELRATLEAVRAVAESDEISAIPGQISTLAEGLQSAADRLNSLLEDFQEQAIIASVSELIDSVDSAVGTFPGLAAQASAILSDAEKVSLETLADRANELLASVEAVIDQDSTRDLPEQVSAALVELKGTLSDLREGNLISNANATFASARDAADALAEASASLPDLAERLSGVASQAGSAFASYDRDSEFNRDLRAAIRQIESAAGAIDRLARQLQRDPSSLITGR
ncbi:intermembrane transport protein PqiB [Pseudoruegeria sp. HB172150]|uniref:PqiB family protein n=1 Tax=Pseudoruegeria sp. HB172150 TaxID=2721164 RepID=UPI0015555E85|nr:MlaD family protein [Pseudoruegeria sp. HB172150]